MLECRARSRTDKTVPCTLANPDTVSNEAIRGEQNGQYAGSKATGPKKGNANQEDHKQRNDPSQHEAEISSSSWNVAHADLDNFHMPTLR